MIKGIIFDMDGVLVDSQPAHFVFDIKSLEKCGVIRDTAFVTQYAGMAGPDRWAKYKKDLALTEDVDTLVARHAATIADCLNDFQFVPIRGVTELLVFLKEKGLRLAVASSSDTAFVHRMLGLLKLDRYFDAIVCGDEITRSKPAPDIFLKAAQVLGLTPERCIVIEDSGAGTLAASRAGIPCVGYINPNSGQQDLSPAFQTIHSFDELRADTRWLGPHEAGR